MIDEARQENIDNPTSIFKKMREKAERDGIVHEKGKRRKELFTMKTPTVDDEEITELCAKYKIKPGDNTNENLLQTKGLNVAMDKLRAEIKKKQNRMI